MFTNAIVRPPAPCLERGITSAPELGRPAYEQACQQHQAYVDALETCGVNITHLPAAPDFPDACFIEDVAVCTPEFALVTTPGAPSRQGEEAGMERILSQFYPRVLHMEEGGTLEGGDVMRVDDHYYIGLSDRTNERGAAQLTSALEDFGMTASRVNLEEMLHLKTGLSYLEDGVLLMTGEFAHMDIFKKYKCIEIPEEEAYGANCIRVNDYVIVPQGYETTRALIQGAGMKTLAVDTSEYRKLDGGLSCLSLRF